MTLDTALCASAPVYDNLGRVLQTRDGSATGPLLTSQLWDPTGFKGHLASTSRWTTVGGTTTTNKTTGYLYDATGSRLLAHLLDTAQPAAENWTLYLGGTELTLTKGATKATGTRYYPLGAATGVRTDDNTLTFQVNDHHGTAEIGINATTGAVDQRRTTPFGGTRGTAPTNWAGTRGFLGGTNEPTGLTHLGARDYDPTTARFTSVDPVLAADDPQSFNGYTYSDNNPLTLSDPSGLSPRGMCDGYGQNSGNLPGTHGHPEDVKPDRGTVRTGAHGASPTDCRNTNSCPETLEERTMRSFPNAVELSKTHEPLRNSKNTSQADINRMIAKYNAGAGTVNWAALQMWEYGATEEETDFFFHNYCLFLNCETGWTAGLGDQLGSAVKSPFAASPDERVARAVASLMEALAARTRVRNRSRRSSRATGSWRPTRRPARPPAKRSRPPSPPPATGTSPLSRSKAATAPRPRR